MTEYHKFQEKGVEVKSGGSNEDITNFNRNLTSYNRNDIMSSQNHGQKETDQKEAKNLSLVTPLSPTMWQEEPADVREKVVQMGPSLVSSENTKLGSKGPSTSSIFIEQEQFDDFSLFSNMNNSQFAPLTPQSLPDSPLIIPTEPHQVPLDSFDDSDEEEYDTVGFFPSLSSIERR